jgi:hypothetical protein
MTVFVEIRDIIKEVHRMGNNEVHW